MYFLLKIIDLLTIIKDLSTEVVPCWSNNIVVEDRYNNYFSLAAKKCVNLLTCNK